uniref:PPPDE peptidase domain-containing protein 2 n=3 Tax=Lygus hesperus TaxID=30085 RepID=A0A0A9Y875_LYGHE
MSEGGEDVYLYIYDLSNGMARVLSPSVIGRQIDGIWHTGIVVYNREYFYGSGGVQVAEPGGVIGPPQEKLKLGTTHVPIDIFEEYLNGLHETEFRGEEYHLLNHNCNNFSDAVSNFLIGSGIPSHIVSLPADILNTPYGQLFRPLIERITNDSSIRANSIAYLRRRAQETEFQELNQDIEAARLHSLALRERRNEIKEKIAKREQKKNKKRKKNPESGDFSHLSKMSESVETQPPAGDADAAQIVQNLEDDERKEREERKKNREPPIVYKDAVDVHIEFDTLVGLIDGKLNEEEQQSLEELHQYMLQDEGSWALGENFLEFIGRLLTDKSLNEGVSLRTLNVLAAAALKDDVILMLHQDRRQHIMMNYAYGVDRLPLPLQQALTLFICNLFENLGSSEWLLYISEWNYNNNQISNIRVTTKVAVNAILSEDEDMRDRGTAILYNLATKEVKLWFSTTWPWN